VRGLYVDFTGRHTCPAAGDLGNAKKNHLE
jgi:hypothetical protein